MSAVALETRGATFAVSGRPLLADVTLTIAEGECVALLGPNGSGKTTLLRLLTGVRRASAGTVLLDGRRVDHVPRPEIACRIAYLPQNTWSDFEIAVADVVAMGRYPHLGAWRSPTAADRDAVHAAMEQVGVQDLARRTLPTLSAGERQRVFVARALAQGSPLLVLDEPTSALDIGHQIELLEILLRLHREGKTIVAAIHDLRLAWHHFPRALLLHRGRLVADGPARSVIEGPAARAAFGVRVATDGELRFSREGSEIHA